MVIFSPSIFFNQRIALSSQLFFHSAYGAVMCNRETASKLVYLEAGALRTMVQLTVASAAVTSTTVELLSGVRASRTTQNRIATMASSLPAGNRNASASGFRFRKISKAIAIEP